MLSFCFYTRTFSVLFPSNKYQIKVCFPFFHLFQNGLRCVFFCAWYTCVLVALNFTLKVEVRGRGRAGAWPAVHVQRGHGFLPPQTVVWAPSAGPHAAASRRDVVRIGNRNSYWHIAQGRKGMEAGMGGGGWEAGWGHRNQSNKK